MSHAIMGEKVLAWLGDAADYVDRKRADMPNPRSPAWIEIVDGRLTFYGAWDGPHGFMLAHDIGHVLAATDEDLFAPNLALDDVGGDDSRSARIEERTMAYQILVFRLILGDKSMDNKIEIGMKIFRSVLSAGKFSCDMVWQLVKELDVQAEWDRKLALIAGRVMVTV